MNRLYGEAPFHAAVIHGGPGAPGYMAPVARELSKDFSIIEPIQTKDTLEGQLKELHQSLKDLSDKPLCLIGSSWGATLALLYASMFKNASKVILIGSCVYDQESSLEVKRIRSERMSVENREKLESIGEKLINSDSPNKLFEEAADLFFESDTFDPETEDLEIIECQYEINKKVWNDFKIIRDTKGELQKIFSNIECPVVNIHGEYDPHILEGIQPFLEQSLGEHKLYLLSECGHYPWIEKKAKNEFFNILRNEL